MGAPYGMPSMPPSDMTNPLAKMFEDFQKSISAQIGLVTSRVSSLESNLAKPSSHVHVPVVEDTDVMSVAPGSQKATSCPMTKTNHPLLIPTHADLVLPVRPLGRLDRMTNPLSAQRMTLGLRRIPCEARSMLFAGNIPMFLCHLPLGQMWLLLTLRLARVLLRISLLSIDPFLSRVIWSQRFILSMKRLPTLLHWRVRQIPGATNLWVLVLLLSLANLRARILKFMALR